MMTHRLQQFWNFGHNCAVLDLTPGQIEEVLIDNRFDRWALSHAEKESFMAGFARRPLQWTRSALKPISIRPIVHIHNGRTNAFTNHDREQSRNRTRVPEHPAVTEKKRIASRKFWDSERGIAMKKQLRAKARKAAR